MLPDRGKSGKEHRHIHTKKIYLIRHTVGLEATFDSSETIENFNLYS